MFRNMAIVYGEDLLASCPNPKLEDHPLLAVHDSLFNISAATLHIGGRSSIHNLATCHVMVTGTHLSCVQYLKFIIVLIYDVIMGISTSYPSMHCTLVDITECGTASCVYADNYLLNYTAIIYCIILLYYIIL